ncbi:MAG TPA: hypothetical protein VFS42_03695 [Burkholderiaceae bacterium]|nr:hypothetical protein [Burkholderiaceae bacterium]
MPDRSFDQATGLRQMFSTPALTVLPLVAAADDVAHAGFALAWAQAVAAQGRRVLVLDAHRGDIAQLLGGPARFDLWHLLAGEREFAEVVRHAGAHVDLVTAIHGLQALIDHPQGAAPLWPAIVNLSARYDTVVVLGTADAIGAMLAGTDAECFLLATREAESIKQTYGAIKRMAADHGCARYRIVVDRAHPHDAENVARRIADCAQRFASARVRLGGSLPFPLPMRQRAASSTALADALETLARRSLAWGWNPLQEVVPSAVVAPEDEAVALVY